MKPLITIFTPTFNRAYIIENLYHSLQRQTNTDFEWLIVDDGSTDQTSQLFEKWMTEENSFPIRYYRQPNGGKCRAINRALDLAQGAWFFTVDSDDYLTDDALEKVAAWVNSLPQDEHFCGVAGNLGTAPDQTPNRLFDSEYLDVTALARYNIVDGERAMVFRTQLHRDYKYPIFDGEKFMTEAVVWNRMAADGYKMRFYNDIIWIYEYKEDGLTKAGSRLFLENPRGYGLWLREKAQFEHSNILQKIKLYYTFTCDLSDRYDCKLIAECIGAPRLLIKVLSAAHKLLQLRKRS